MTARGMLPSVPAAVPGGACDREANAPAGEVGVDQEPGAAPAAGEGPHDGGDGGAGGPGRGSSGGNGWAGMGADAATPPDPVDVASGQGEHLPAMICPLASVVSVIIIT
jgi:hypothetical protein